MKLTVRIGDRVFRLACYRGPDGLLVADPRGAKESKALWQTVKQAFAERIKPGTSPFAFKTWTWNCCSVSDQARMTL